MKAMNKMAGLALAAYAVLVLAACSGTSNSSVPTTSTTSVVGQTTCPAQGYYSGANGVYTPCTPGQVINNGYIAPTGYTGTSYPTGGTGCSSYYAQYGQPYVPIYLDGQLVCANYYALMQSMQSQQSYASYAQTQYYQNPNYYYAYPPQAYSSSYYGSGYYGGSSCGASFAVSIGSVAAGLCFN